MRCGHDDCAAFDEMAQECAARIPNEDAWECEPTTFGARLLYEPCVAELLA